MSVHSLPNDVSRCTGVACKLRQECRRWLSWKHDFNKAEVLVSNFTQNQDGNCDHKIDRMDLSADMGDPTGSKTVYTMKCNKCGNHFHSEKILTALYCDKCK